jgi:2-polyprenyl-3-methyl-5-hydroxy-6-metoxy-1,4-benzoquinol methylase
LIKNRCQSKWRNDGSQMNSTLNVNISTACPACGESSVFESSVFNADIYCCSTCKMIHAVAKGVEATNRKNVVDTNPDYFAGTIKAYAEQSKIAERVVPARLVAYEKRLGHPVRKVLEIGPGSGAYAKAFANNNIEYRGIEIQPEIGEQTRKLTGQDIRVGDFLTELGLGSGYDVVFASQVFEHIQTPRQFLARVKEVAPNGLLHIDVPNHGSIVSIIRKLVSKTEYGFIQPPYHMLAYTTASLKTLLEREALRDVSVRAYSNDDEVWGQLTHDVSYLTRLVFLVGRATGRGSLLTAVAKI